MALGKGIPVINGFDLNSKLPLDSRTVADTMEEMNALVTNGSVTDGQLCYCKADKKLYVLKDNAWSEVGGGGGKSVPPTLDLIDWDTGEVRTSITEEEYNNLKNGLYNQINYFTEDPYEIYLQSKLTSSYNDSDKSLNCVFSNIKVTTTSETDISSTNIVYRLSTGQKDTSGNYPITIQKQTEIPFSSSSGSSTSSDSMHVIVKKSENGKITLTEAEFDNLTKDNYELAINTGDDLFIYDEKSVVKDSSTGNVDSIGFICTTVRGTGQLILMNTSSVRFTRDNLVSDIVKITSLMTESKLFNKKVMTYDSYSPENILPCTTADNGKVLSIVNGEAQWATPTGGGGVTITFED